MGDDYEDEEDDEEDEHEGKVLPPWIICPDCEGEGKHVHEDLSVWTASDREENPDGFDDMMRGHYDVKCERCQGSGKVREGETVSLRRGAPGQPYEVAGILHNADGEPLEAYRN